VVLMVVVMLLMSAVPLDLLELVQSLEPVARGLL
jgi:hypothetical protein